MYHKYWEKANFFGMSIGIKIFIPVGVKNIPWLWYKFFSVIHLQVKEAKD